MFNLDGSNLCTQPVECLPDCPGVLCASWDVFVSTDHVEVHRGSSSSLHKSSFRRHDDDALSAFDKTPLRFC